MKLLIVNPFGIGDVIFSTPLVQIVRKHYRDAFIGYICNKRSCEVIRNDPGVNRVYVYEKDDFRELWGRSRPECLREILRFLQQVRGERFDVSIDLSLGYVYSMALMLIGIRRRFGFNYRDRGIFLTGRIDIDGFTDKHVVEYYLDFLSLLDIERSRYSAAPKVYAGETDRQWADVFLTEHGVRGLDTLIGIIPGCGASWGKDAVYRRWSPEGFAAVADRLSKLYAAKIILFGDERELPICEAVQEMMRRPAIVACGKTSIGGFLGLVSRCALVVTNDGGPLHMAGGLGAKTVSIFGPVDERIYGPYPPGAGHHAVVASTTTPCRPCYRKFKYTHCADLACLKAITVEEVLLAAERLLVSERVVA